MSAIGRDGAAADPRRSGAVVMADGATRRLDVRGDRVDQLRLAREGTLVAQPLPELDHEPPAVQVAVEVEQVRLDPQRRAAVVRVDADRDRGAR